MKNGKLKQRNRPHITLRNITSRRIIIAGTFTILSISLFLHFYLLTTKNAYGATAGDYISVSNGQWSSASSWNMFDGTNWVNAVTPPTSANGNIDIKHNITIQSASVTADQLQIFDGATLTINSGYTLTIANGAGTDLTVMGTLTNKGTLAQAASTTISLTGLGNINPYNSSAVHTVGAGSVITIGNGSRYVQASNATPMAAGNLVVNSGGVYEINAAAPVIPIATWNTGSTLEITGAVSTKPVNLNQSFYNFTWNANQSAEIDFQAELTTVNGNLTMLNSGTKAVLLCDDEDGYTINVGGNIDVQNGSLYICTEGHPTTVNVGGNITISGGKFWGTDLTPVVGSSDGSGWVTINLTGNFNMSGGIFDMTQNNQNSGGLGYTQVNIQGNFIQTGGTIKETAAITSGVTGYGLFNFIKSGTQIFTGKGGNAITNTVHFTVNNGSILDMDATEMSGGGNFSLMSGGGLISAHSAGITATSSSGSVQVTGTRSYSTSANYTYDGNVAQVTGDGLPATVNNLTFNNSNHVTMTNSSSVSGILSLVSGQVITNANELIVTNSATSSINSYSTTNYVRGNLRRYVNASGSYDFPIGTAAYYEMVNLNLSGIGGFTNILGAFTNASPINSSYPLSSLTLNNTAIDTTLSYGYWTFTPNNAMSSGTYSITLKEKGHSNPGRPQSYIVLKRTNSTSSWQSIGTNDSTLQSESGGTASAIRSGLTGFSQFSIGKSRTLGTLPIKLLYFNAKKNGDKVDLSWATAAEINNEYFTVERSTDGKVFAGILTKRGAGNSTNTLYYSDVDNNPLTGQSYYRLKQTDYDGHFTYSNIKAISTTSKIGDIAGDVGIKFNSIAPNPFTDNLNISFESSDAGTGEILLHNSSGQKVYEKMIEIQAGTNQFEYSDDKGLPSGIYFLVIQSGDKRAVKKVYKK